MLKKVAVLLFYGLLANQIVSAKNLQESSNTLPQHSVKKLPRLHAYDRKLIKITAEGKYLVQDFYETGEKLTDPYVMDNPLKLIIFNEENKDLSSLSLKDNYRYYRFYNAYDTFAGIDGKLTTWYKNGQKRSSEEYYSDKSYINSPPVGKQLFWYKNGVIAREIDYEKYSKTAEGIHANIPVEEASFYISGGWHIPKGIITHYKAWYPNKQQWENSQFNKTKTIIQKWYDNGQQKIVYHLKDIRNPETTTKLIVWDKQGKTLTDPKLSTAYKHNARYFRIRKILKKTTEGYLIQEFYLNGKKSTDPFLTQDKFTSKPEQYADPLYDINYKCLSGKVAKYNLNGQKIEEQICSKDHGDISVKSWHNNGQLKLQYEVKNHKIGKVQEWYDNGQLKSEILFYDYTLSKTLQRGRLYETEYYPNGQLKYDSILKITYGTNPNLFKLENSYWMRNTKLIENKITFVGAHGEKSGLVTHWYANGQIAGKGEYLFMMKKHNWTYWDEQGNEIIIQNLKKP